MKVSKVMTAKEAVSKFVPDGSTIAIGSFFHTIAYDITHEIIRQQKKKLTICAPSFNEHADQLIGAGCVDRIVSSYVWMEVFGPLYCFRRAMDVICSKPNADERQSSFVKGSGLMANQQSDVRRSLTGFGRFSLCVANC